MTLAIMTLSGTNNALHSSGTTELKVNIEVLILNPIVTLMDSRQ
jgi:hypothetical protein